MELQEMAGLEELLGITFGNHDNSEESLDAYYDWTNGCYSVDQAPYYFLQMRKKELLPHHKEYSSKLELAKAWLELPKTTPVWYQLMKDKPSQWKDEYGDFPEDGLLIGT